MITPERREYARSLTLRYLVASTAILLVSGLLGLLLRFEPGRPRPRLEQHVVRDHDRARPRRVPGLGRLRVMGLSWWVLAEVGVPLRRLSAALAEITWWLMVVGVFGVVVTTLSCTSAAPGSSSTRFRSTASASGARRRRGSSPPPSCSSACRSSRGASRSWTRSSDRRCTRSAHASSTASASRSASATSGRSGSRRTRSLSPTR